MARRSLVSLLLALACALAACGGGGTGAEGAPGDDATVLLDFQPNAVHSGIYTAAERDFDAALGVQLDVQVPSSSTDAVKLLAAREVDFAVLDIHDLAIARQEGAHHLVGVMALVQRPLGAVLALPPVEDPRDLEGRRVGVTGLPSDEAVLESIVRGAGGEPGEVETVTIGFNAVGSLLAGEVAAATAFWNVEGLALERERPRARQFRVDEYGAPRYPELVLTTSRTILEEDPELVRATLQAVARGYERVIEDPASGASLMADAVDGAEREAIVRQLDAVLPAFTAGADAFGELDPERLRAWARWEAEFGITRRPPDVAQTFDGRYVPGLD